MRALHGDGLEALLLASLVKELNIKGTLHVLRHGFKFYGKTFRIANFKPAHGLNEEVLLLYSQNRLTVTRQVPVIRVSMTPLILCLPLTGCR